MRKGFKIQIIQHAHALILCILCLVITFLGIRSAYLLFIAIFFYGLSLILNLVTTLHHRGKSIALIIPLVFMFQNYISLCRQLLDHFHYFGSNIAIFVFLLYILCFG